MQDHEFIDSPQALAKYLDYTRKARRFDFDTEFISEGKYRTELCLIQVATEFGLVLLDPQGIGDLTPFWERICQPEVTVTAHSARSEMEFCYRAIGRIPENLFDIQLAAAFVGSDYPSSLKRLAEEYMNVALPKDETRTDWRARPLSSKQEQYALDDVRYLHGITLKIFRKLETLGRTPWFLEETRGYLARMLQSFTTDKWQKISGISSLGRRELAIVVELSKWRENSASQKGRVPKYILRDDIIVELAKRKSSDPARIADLRSLCKRNNLHVLTEELSAVIENALTLPEADLPCTATTNSYPSYQIASAFLLSFIHNEAKRGNIAPCLIATPRDARDFVAYKAGTLPEGITPRLATGWRKEFLGSVPNDLLDGKAYIRFDMNNLGAPLCPEKAPGFMKEIRY